MANNKQRYVNTRFWNDNYVSELDPSEKLLFMYFLTNEHTNISGVYELPLKIVAVETGLDKTMLEKMIPRLKDKIGYIRGFVVIKNFLKHQETRSPLTLKGIENCLADLDQEWLKELINKGDYIIEGIKFEGVCKGYARVSNYSYSYSDSNLDSDSNTMSAVADGSFEPFWSIYPKKELKKKTKEIWERKKLGSKLEEICSFIEKAKNTDRWQKGYIKQPPVFLNGECWNDDLASYGGVKIKSNNHIEPTKGKYDHLK